MPDPAFRPHPDAPVFSRPDALKVLSQLIDELQSPNFQAGEAVRIVLRQAGLTCLWFFLKFILGATGPYDKLNEDLHVDMCNFRSSAWCMEPGSKVFAFLPRDHRKTTIFTHGGNTWELTRDPNIRIGLVNAIAGRAAKFMHQIMRNIDSNPLYQWLYPENIPPLNRNRRRNWTDKEMVIPSRTRSMVEPSVKPLGAEGAGEGDHFDLLNVDDLLGLGDLTVEMLSSVDMYKKMQWFKTNHKTLVDSWTESRVIGVATRYGQDDVYQWVVDRSRTCIGYPMPGFKPNPNGEWVIYYRNVIENGSFIQPETMDEDQYRQLAEDDPWTTKLQYENDASGAGMSEFQPYPVKRCYWEYIEGAGFFIIIPENGSVASEEERISLNECDVAAGCDPAGGKRGLHAKVCQSAVAVWARDPKDRLFLLYLRHGYWSPFELFDEIFAAVDVMRGHIRVFGVESNAMQKILIPLLNEDKLKREKVVYFEEVKSTTKKDPRIRMTIGAPLQAGRIYAAPGPDIEFISQKDKFPMAEFHKDILDASEMAINLTFRPDTLEEREEYDRAMDEFVMSRDAVTGY